MKSTDIDPRSAEPVLYYVGPGIVGGIPADDLSGNRLARIAWIRKGPERPFTPADVPQKDITAIRDELVATGKYGTKPVTPAAEVTDE